MDKEGVLRERGERLREAAGAVGIMQAAKRANVPYTTLRDYMAGGDMRLSIVAALARVCGVTVDWIAYGGERQPRDAAEARTTATPSQRAPVDMDWLSLRLGIRSGDLVVFEAIGDAMEPVIRDGDLLVAHRLERAVIAPAVYAIDVDGNLVARRLEQRVDGALVVRTDNTRYEAHVLGPTQDRPFLIIGPVVWQAGALRS